MSRNFLAPFMLLSGAALTFDFASAQQAPAQPPAEATPVAPGEDPLEEVVVHGIKRGDRKSVV